MNFENLRAGLLCAETFDRSQHDKNTREQTNVHRSNVHDIFLSDLNITWDLKSNLQASTTGNDETEEPEASYYPVQYLLPCARASGQQAFNQ